MFAKDSHIPYSNHDQSIKSYQGRRRASPCISSSTSRICLLAAGLGILLQQPLQNNNKNNYYYCKAFTIRSASSIASRNNLPFLFGNNNNVWEQHRSFDSTRLFYRRRRTMNNNNNSNNDDVVVSAKQSQSYPSVKATTQKRRKRTMPSSSAIVLKGGDNSINPTSARTATLQKQTKKKNSTNKRTLKKISYSSAPEHMIESEMMSHELLSMAEEQVLGLAIQRSKSVQESLDLFIAEKKQQQQQQQDLVMSVKNTPVVILNFDDPIENEEDDDDDDSDDDEEYFDSLSMIYNDGRQGISNREAYNKHYDMTSIHYNNEDDLSMLQKLHSKSRIAKVRLHQATYDDDYSMLDKNLQELSAARTNFERDIAFLEDKNNGDSEIGYDCDDDDDDDRLLLVSDEEVRNQLQLLGGKAELRQILSEGAVARDTLIRSNLKLVSSIAKKWSKLTSKNEHSTLHAIYNGSWDRPSLSEAIQEGTLGLMDAVERYNPNRGLRFSTYATFWITNSIRRCFRKTLTGGINLPQHIHDKKTTFKKLVKQYYETMGHVPEIAILAKDMKMSVKKLQTIVKVTRPLLSTDAPLIHGSKLSSAGKAGGDNDGEILLSDTLVACDSIDDDPEHRVELSLLRQCLENIMAVELQPHERDVIRLRLGLDDGVARTCTEVAQQCLGGTLSASDVRAAEQKAFKKLRSPMAVSKYKLFAYLDFADVDRKTMKIR